LVAATAAGLGLVTNGTNPNQLDVNVSARLAIVSDTVDLASGIHTATGSAGSGTIVQSHTVDTYGRVTATTYAALPFTATATSTSTATATAAAASNNVTFARKAIGVGIGTGTSMVVNHGLGQWVHAQLFDSSTGALVETDVTNAATSGGTTTFTFSSSQTLTGFQYVIVG
jgi:hypothetical protein